MSDKTDVRALVKYAQSLEAENESLNTSLRIANEAIERLRAALEPFADFFPKHYGPDDLVITNGSPMAKHQLTMGDLRRAKAAYEQKADK